MKIPNCAIERVSPHNNAPVCATINWFNQKQAVVTEFERLHFHYVDSPEEH